MAFEAWVLTAAANVVIVALYAAISMRILRGVHDGHQWRSNPIAVATAGVFATCAVGHGLHVAHVVPPWSILDPVSAASGVAMFGDWRLIAWDAFTGAVAVWYFVLRNRFAIMYQGASLCEDMTKRQEQARLLRAQLVDGLRAAQASFDAGAREEGIRGLDRTLEQGKDIISTLLGDEARARPHPGDLRRRVSHH